MEPYKCQLGVMRQCEIYKTGGCDGTYNGGDCECAADNHAYMPSTERDELKAYRALGTVEELTLGAVLVKAQDEGLIQPMSCTGCRYDQTSRLREHEAHCMRCIRNRYPDDHYNHAEAEAALGGGGDG